MDDDTLQSKEYESILECLDLKKSVLIHGVGGSGKSFLIKKIATDLKTRKIEFFLTATTGIAAINLSIPEYKLFASTVHSALGLRLGNETDQQIVARLFNSKMYLRNWKDMEVLIIDEISMMGATLFDKIDYIGRSLRKNDKPFGGITLLLCGDFLQLPPVKDEYVFKSKVWPKIAIIPFILHKPRRYDDIAYFDLLGRLRKGNQTKDDIAFLKSRVDAYVIYKKEEKTQKDIHIKPTILYSQKKDVEAFNMAELDKLEGSPIIFNAFDEFKPKSYGFKKEKYIIHFDDTIPSVIALKKGAQVMLKANLDTSEGLANGTRGVVTDISAGTVTVKFMNKEPMLLEPHTWDIEDETAKASRTQIPLILAYSSTIHRIQGLTLDLAVCDIGTTIFLPFQAYVALSRVRNREGLYISGFSEDRLMIDEEAIKFVEGLENKEEEDNNSESSDSIPYTPEFSDSDDS
jgi:ATP-dependent DNA helicase PIF1